MAKSDAASTQQTSVTTQTVTDSFNQAFTRTTALSDVGNFNLSIAGEGALGGPSTGQIMIVLGAIIAGIFLLKRKG